MVEVQLSSNGNFSLKEPLLVKLIWCYKKQTNPALEKIQSTRYGLQTLLMEYYLVG